MSMRLRANVVESTLMLQADIGYMTAVASLYGHDKADVDKGSAQTNKLYFNAMANIPYMTGGKTGDDAAMEERQKAVDRYQDMKRRMYKNLDEK